MASTPNKAPTLLAKANCNEPLVDLIGLISMAGVGTGTLMTILLALWMPLTNRQGQFVLVERNMAAVIELIRMVNTSGFRSGIAQMSAWPVQPTPPCFNRYP